MTTDGPATFASAATQLDRPTYENLRRALQLGRWPDGRAMDARQREICLDAVLTWEATNLPPEARTGFVERRECASEAEARPIRILGDE